MLKKFLFTAALLQTPILTPTIDKIIEELRLLRQIIETPPPVEVEVTVSTSVGLQVALDSAAPVIRVLPGTYVGNFVLKNKPTKTIVKGIEFTGRAKPDYIYPKLVALDKFTAVIKTLESAHDYTFQGLEFTGVAGDRNVIEIGARGETTVSQLPYNITFNQVYIHGVNGFGHRGIFFDVVNGVVTKSYFSEFVEQGRDSNAIGAFNGAGPYLIDDSYFEASGEGIIFGGSDPTIPFLIPSDITITNNTFFKPIAWKQFPGSVKNCFELKSARNVVIKNNVFDGSWADAQSGSCILFTVRNQDGKCPWCNIINVEFACNTIKNISNYAIGILGTDNNHPSGTAENIHIHHNLMNSVNGIQVGAGTKILEIEDNVFLGIKGSFLGFYGVPVFGFRFTGNSTVSGAYGLSGDNTTLGTVSLDTFAPNSFFKTNRIETTPLRTIRYPPENTMLAPGTVKESDLIPCK